MAAVSQNDYYSVSEIKLSYHSQIKAADRPQICRSQDSYAVFRKYWEDDKLDFIEQSKLLLLNRANRVLGICNLSTGSTTGTIIDTRMVFAAALKANASNIIVAHNHPSENLEPSNADRDITRRLQEAGQFMSIPVFDHLIIARRGYYSFSDDEKFLIPDNFWQQYQQLKGP